tara:strand:+ start:224 stop:826 length:603 start_codon:yes stop_codon:yes gene_type:complete
MPTNTQEAVSSRLLQEALESSKELKSQYDRHIYADNGGLSVLNSTLGLFREAVALHQDPRQNNCNIFELVYVGTPCGKEGEERRRKFLSLKPLLHNQQFLTSVLTLVKVPEDMKKDLKLLEVFTKNPSWKVDLVEFLRIQSLDKKSDDDRDFQDNLLAQLRHGGAKQGEHLLRPALFLLRREREEEGWSRRIFELLKAKM